MTTHSRLGASSSHRWMACPGSVRLTANIPDSGSAYAAEGTRAHELAEWALRMGPETDPVDAYPEDMAGYVRQYVDYVREIEARTGGSLLVEERLDYSAWVSGGYGTADAVILAEDAIHVVDLKYGQGVRVDAPGNSQARLYALGAYDRHYLGYAFREVVTHIVQPRLDHISTEVLTIDELLAFGEEARAAAARALDSNAPLVPGEKQCRFCAARATCRARAQQQLEVAGEEFGERSPPDTLSLEEIAALLPHLDELKAWASDVQKFALDSALAGAPIAGYKVVEGRSMRRWTDAAVQALSAHEAADRLFSRKLVGIGEAEKILGKRSELVAELTEKPAGSPVLVPVTDKRPELQGVSSAAADFGD